MKGRIRVRFWVESCLALTAFALGIVTVFWRDWIEAIFGVDPDRGSGALEWGIVFGLLGLSLIVGAMANRDWRRHRVREDPVPVLPAGP